jgi:uncharacterized protein with FMN-binding domain
MKRIVLWLLSTVSAVVLLFGYHTSTSGPAATAQEPVGASLATTSTATTSGGSGSGGSNGSSGSSSSTVTGKVAQTRWGPVQVQLTTDPSGTITSVEVVQYPSGNREDEQINSYALPRLVHATLDAQSADIDMVSGATVTSEGYLQSLQSALDQAKA